MLNCLVLLIKLPITLNISALFSYDNCELPCSIKLNNQTFSMLPLLRNGVMDCISLLYLCMLIR